MARKVGKKKTKTASKAKTRKSKYLWGRWLLKWAFVLGLWLAIVVAGIVAWYGQELPDITKDTAFERKAALTIKAGDGSVIAHYGDLKGQTVQIDDVPANLVHAVLAIEDRRFYSHFGLDPLGLARAMGTNLIKGRVAQGGSTITQQLAKNLFLSRERTLKRKIQEALLALWLERELTKDEILSAYLNRVYLGSGTYGVDAAARLYFDKDISDLTLEESATIAGLLKAPSRYSPLNNPQLSRARTRVVLGAMVDAGYIKSTEESDWDSAPVPLKKPGAPRDLARYYTDWVVDGLEDLIGTPSEDLIIETTLNPSVQKAAEIGLSQSLSSNGEEYNFSQGSVVVMRPDGAVVALVGGADHSQSQFNRVVQAKRPPGSAFKPIVYLTALENGWNPSDRVLDAPITSGRYKPKNFGNKYRGEVTLDEALTYSLNTAVVRLMQETGRRPVIEMARRLGIYSNLSNDLSLALGSSGMSPLELTTAYTVFANGGVAVYPYAITRITDKNGVLYYERPARKALRRVVSSSDIAELNGMLRHVIEQGTGRAAQVGGFSAGKTGTSQDYRDAWFVGFTDTLVAGVWLGNDDNTSMKSVTGGKFPAQIWRDVMVQSRGLYSPIDVSVTGAGGFGLPDFDNTAIGSLLGRLLGGGHSEAPFVPDGSSPTFVPSSEPNLHKTREYND